MIWQWLRISDCSSKATHEKLKLQLILLIRNHLVAPFKKLKEILFRIRTKLSEKSNYPRDKTSSQTKYEIQTLLLKSKSIEMITTRERNVTWKKKSKYTFYFNRKHEEANAQLCKQTLNHLWKKCMAFGLSWHIILNFHMQLYSKVPIGQWNIY